MSIGVLFLICAVRTGAGAYTSKGMNASQAFLEHSARLSDDIAVTQAYAVAERPAIWPSTSKFGTFVQCLLAGMWIIMIACLPSIVPLLTKKKPTQSQITVGLIMIVVFFGGLYLFTNIILFQSVHFEQIRPLTIIECMYFMSQVITTVGYGDITPAKVRGQVFVGMYVLGAIFVISMVISDVVNQAVESVEKFKDELLVMHAQQDESEDEHHRRNKNNLDKMLHLRPAAPPSFTDVYLALAVFAVIDIIWVIFFSSFPGEDKTVFQCIYMSIITLSSVGFGAYTPITEEGMIFGAYFMLFGCCALVNVVSQFTELMVKLNEYEKHNLEVEKEDANTVLDGVCHTQGKVSELEFLKFCVLQMHHVDENHLDEITKAFQSMQPVQGCVPQASIQQEILGIADGADEA